MPFVLAGLTTASISKAKGLPNSISKEGLHLAAVITAFLLSYQNIHIRVFHISI